MPTSFHHPSSQPLQAGKNETNGKSVQIMLHFKPIVVATRCCISLQNPCCSGRTAPRARDITGFSIMPETSPASEHSLRQKRCLSGKERTAGIIYITSCLSLCFPACASQTPMDSGLEWGKQYRRKANPSTSRLKFAVWHKSEQLTLKHFEGYQQAEEASKLKFPPVV